MSQQLIFVNLPVQDLPRAKEFFAELGYSFNPQFTDENAACLVISDSIYFMLLTEPFFKTFTKREIPDPATHVGNINCLSAESREAVDAIVDRAIAAGAKEHGQPEEMGDFMYGRNFTDLDGHLWSYMWMDVEAAAAAGGPAA
ncbi:VOC family protein [Streptomyces polyrhachis]|uniref:VOC family protein n=1 Tax=Streptomyces polyrhachis TaxID=1282885 RepID=A0ABW2GGT4_9ACTN